MTKLHANDAGAASNVIHSSKGWRHINARCQTMTDMQVADLTLQTDYQAIGSTGIMKVLSASVQNARSPRHHIGLSPETIAFLFPVMRIAHTLRRRSIILHIQQAYHDHDKQIQAPSEYDSLPTTTEASSRHARHAPAWNCEVKFNHCLSADRTEVATEWLHTMVVPCWVLCTIQLHHVSQLPCTFTVRRPHCR